MKSMLIAALLMSFCGGSAAAEGNFLVETRDTTVGLTVTSTLGDDRLYIACGIKAGLDKRLSVLVVFPAQGDFMVMLDNNLPVEMNLESVSQWTWISSLSKYEKLSVLSYEPKAIPLVFDLRGIVLPLARLENLCRA